MEKNLVFTGRCTVLSMSYSLEQLLWRTLQQSLFEGLEQYLDRYPKSGTMRNGVLYERVTSEPLIKGRDGFVSLTRERLDTILAMNGNYLPTPTASDPRKHHSGGLHRWIIKGERYSKGDHRMQLPTPTKNEAHNSPGTLSQWERKGSLNVEAAKMEGYTKETIGKNFRLNPRFVEEMMGFPIGWTELQP